MCRSRVAIPLLIHVPLVGDDLEHVLIADRRTNTTKTLIDIHVVVAAVLGGPEVFQRQRQPIVGKIGEVNVGVDRHGVYTAVKMVIRWWHECI